MFLSLTIFVYSFKWHIEFKMFKSEFLSFNLESLDMEQHHSFKFNADLVYMYIFFSSGEELMLFVKILTMVCRT